MNFDGFHPFTTLKKTDDRTLFFFGACCKRGRHLYTTTAPSCCIPASYCHLSATLQTMSIIVVNLQDNREVFRIFIALLRFSFDSTSYTLQSQTAIRHENYFPYSRLYHVLTWSDHLHVKYVSSCHRLYWIKHSQVLVTLKFVLKLIFKY